MDDIKKRVGERLRAAREKKNLKQNYVAKLLGIHNSTLAKYETGGREADYETLKKLADLYEVKIDSLTESKRQIIKDITTLAGDPLSEERKNLSKVVVEEVNKLPQDTQKALLELIRSFRR